MVSGDCKPGSYRQDRPTHSEYGTTPYDSLRLRAAAYWMRTSAGPRPYATLNTDVFAFLRCNGAIEQARRPVSELSIRFYTQARLDEAGQRFLS